MSESFDDNHADICEKYNCDNTAFVNCMVVNDMDSLTLKITITTITLICSVN